MTDVLEVLLELEYLRADLVRHPLKVGSSDQDMTLLVSLVNLLAMTLRAITSKDCLAHLEQIGNGDMT